MNGSARFFIFLLLFTFTIFVTSASAQEPKRVLLLGQKPDGHPKTTHEYMAGQRLLAEILSRVDGLEVSVVQADSPWEEGPDLIRNADGVVLFVSEGARWIHEDKRRYDAFAQLAERKGGMVAFHWATGTKPKEHVEPFLKLFGACHGGPDRKVGFHDVTLKPADVEHPILEGLSELTIRDEWYYQLKRLDEIENLQPLLTAEIEGNQEMIAWAWTRDNGGRSFGFTGLHFHENWKQETYRRLIAQAVLWSVDIPVPENGIDVHVDDKFYSLEE